MNRNLKHYYCHSTLAEIKQEGFSAKGLKLLTGGNRKFPHSLPFKRSDITSIQIKSVARMSISGVQDKISLKLERGQLEPVESRGEYLLKPVPSLVIPEFTDDVPANEHLTMQIASQIFRISTAANAALYLSDGSMAYITKRFDYCDGIKIPQEDFCQLSARTPESGGENYKYNGSYEEMGGMIRKYCKASIVEIEKLYRQIVFNYIFSNGDAHLKNFSLQATPYGDYVLTPAYDLICTALHFPNESRTALEMFDDFESDFFRDNAFYGREDFIKLAEIYGIQKMRAEANLAEFRTKTECVINLINRSFLSPAAKFNYRARFEERLKAIR